MSIHMPSKSALDSKKLYIFDLDGTVYLGKNVFPFAIRFIDHLRASGRRILFFTNNASRSKDLYVEHLTRMGFSPTRDEIMSSGDVMEAYLKANYPGKSVYVLGTKSLRDQFRAGGIHTVDESAPTADIVVSSYDTELTFEKLCQACLLIRGGATWLCTHPDVNCPSERGSLPDSGSLAALITTSTGATPIMLGKPHGEVLDMIELTTGLSRADMCIFGDRLYTDIALGVRHGMDSLLVLTGETTVADLEAADPADLPTYVLPSLAEADELLFGATEMGGDEHGV